VAIGRQADTSETPRIAVQLALGGPNRRVLALAAALALCLLIVLLSAPRAEAVPTVTYKCTPAPDDCSGWYRSNVSIDWTVQPADATTVGCEDKTYTADTAGTDAFCSANDGEPSGPVQVTIRIDKTAPETTAGTPSRGADANGWYNSPVQISFRGTDDASGIDTCTAPTYSGPDSGSASLSGTCRDRAGNVSAPFPYGLKYDATDPTVTGATPARSPSSAGWFNRPVLVRFDGTDQTSGIDTCSSTTYGGPETAGTSLTGTCTDRAGNRSAVGSFGLKYDETAPEVTDATPDRPPNDAGWYNQEVVVTYSGTDALSGIEACSSPSYFGPDSATAKVTGTCTDRAGNQSIPLALALKYDETDPVVTGAQAERPPDQADWYLAPVRFDFTGTDAKSGIAACPSVTYSGPDGPASTVTGTCSDRAGNVSQLSLALKFDGNPPAVTDLKLTPGDRRLDLSWNVTADVVSVEVVRTPGVGGQASTVVFGGPGTSFTDERVDNGVHYQYVVTVRDSAGNSASGTVSGIPGHVPGGTPGGTSGNSPALSASGAPDPPVKRLRRPRLIAPLPGAIVRMGDPPLLRWMRVRRARYYNVQIFRAGRKILTAWPVRPRYQLAKRWMYAGKSHPLSPGRYRWIVWPGFGPRSHAEYGKPIGRSNFVVRR
jgi:hypothetical protein